MALYHEHWIIWFHWLIYCFFNSLFTHTSKMALKFHITSPQYSESAWQRPIHKGINLRLIKCPNDGLLNFGSTLWQVHISGLIPWLCHSQWETALQSNTVSHWLGANLESALIYIIRPKWIKQCWERLRGWKTISFWLLAGSSPNYDLWLQGPVSI